jgi:hypothetical protein
MLNSQDITVGIRYNVGALRVAGLGGLGNGALQNDKIDRKRPIPRQRTLFEN